MNDYRIDARGKPCPKPLMMLRKAWTEVSVGTSLVILLDNEMAAANVRRFLESNGATPVVVQDATNLITVTVEKLQDSLSTPPESLACAPVFSSPAPVAGVPETTSAALSAALSAAAIAALPATSAGVPIPNLAASGSTVFVFTHGGMGHGSDELGRILIQACINTLADLDPKPQTLIFYNSAVHLATTGSTVLHSLQQLSHAGVKILVCGTCLDYFQLKDQLQVGVISNMFEILEHLTQAGKIIQP